MPSLARIRWQFTAVIALAIAAVECRGIEMFTYFGDGSRIGLPSLEVPIEAYPGIPLRSDRIRARQRAMRRGPNAAVRIGPPGYAGGITIRSMPQPVEAAPGNAAVDTTPPMPPEPDILGFEPTTESTQPTAKKIRGEAESISAPTPED
jgi:hypothetical protein